jgi:hypothetical protein
VIAGHALYPKPFCLAGSIKRKKALAPREGGNRAI